MNYYIIYSLTYPLGALYLGAALYFERIRGRIYCLRGGHSSFKITVIRDIAKNIFHRRSNFSSVSGGIFRCRSTT